MMLRTITFSVARTAVRTSLSLGSPSLEVVRRAAATILPVAALQVRASILKYYFNNSESGYLGRTLYIPRTTRDIESCLFVIIHGILSSPTKSKYVVSDQIQMTMDKEVVVKPMTRTSLLQQPCCSMLSPDKPLG